MQLTVVFAFVSAFPQATFALSTATGGSLTGRGILAPPAGITSSYGLYPGLEKSRY